MATERVNRTNIELLTCGKYSVSNWNCWLRPTPVSILYTNELYCLWLEVYLQNLMLEQETKPNILFHSLCLCNNFHPSYTKQGYAPLAAFSCSLTRYWQFFSWPALIGQSVEQTYERTYRQYVGCQLAMSVPSCLLLNRRATYWLCVNQPFEQPNQNILFMRPNHLFISVRSL